MSATIELSACKWEGNTRTQKVYSSSDFVGSAPAITGSSSDVPSSSPKDSRRVDSAWRAVLVVGGRAGRLGDVHAQQDGVTNSDKNGKAACIVMDITLWRENPFLAGLGDGKVMWTKCLLCFQLRVHTSSSSPDVNDLKFNHLVFHDRSHVLYHNPCSIATLSYQ